MAARWLRLGVMVCLLATSAAVAVAAPALGFETHEFEGSFGEEGAFGSHFPEGRPGALAIDPVTGGVYVGDGFYHNTVQRFDAAHAPEAFTGIGPSISMNKLGGFGISFWQLAVSATSEDLYVASGGPVSAFQSSGEPADFSAGPGAGTNELPGAEVCGVAVDASGDIYVSEYSSGVSVFAASGQPLTKFTAPGVCELAVDSHGVVYATALPTAEQGVPGAVERFVPSGPPPVGVSTTYAAATTVDAAGAFTVAVDPNTNRLYVDEGSQIAEYDEAGKRTGAFGFSEPGALPSPDRFGSGLAVSGASGKVYVGQGDFEGQVEVFGPAVLLPDVTTGEASEISPTGAATLNGLVNPDGMAVTECYFEYGTTSEYGQRAECDPDAGEIGAGTSEVAVTAKLNGLEPGVTYHFRLVASNRTAANNNPPHYGADETFPTPPRPVISASSTENLTASSVDLAAKVNPGGMEVSDCHFEYGASTAYGHTVACEQTVGAGTNEVPVSGHAEGLSPNVTYHWRVVATNAAGTTAGVDHTFIYDTSGEGLPDHRAYEMVTPPQKNGALIGDVLFGVPPDVAESGARVMLTSIQCFADAESCTADRQSEGEPFLFTRTASGWVTKALAPPGRLETNSLWQVSAEAGTALFSAPTLPMSEDDFYVRRDDSSFVDIGPATPPADEAQGWPWGAAGISATSDFSHVVYQEAATWWSSEGGSTPFEYSGTGNAAPVLVGVSGGRGSTDLISACDTALGNSSNGLAPGTLSADGETVFFKAEPCAHGTGANAATGVPVAEVYARVDGARTAAISEPSAFTQAAPYPGCETAACVANVNERAQWQSASFEGASDDGSTAFFSSPQQLTDGASQGGANLYQYDFDASSGEHLIDVSAGDTSGRGARVEGVVAISPDGSHLYFVAQGVLTSAGNPRGEAAQDGANNLYVFERDAGHPQGRVAFVARLPESDSEQWAGGGDRGLANVTPDGRYLVFESHAELTPDDSRTDGSAQIFRYDSQSGELTRVSIGQRGFDDNGNAGVGDAKIVPATSGWTHGGPARSDPTMSHDGSFIFFESPIGLTAHALDDVQIGAVEEPYYNRSRPVYAQNVYEWHEGQVHLISDGKDTAEFSGSSSAVGLVGSDATGSNVFFKTADPLVAQDTDTQIDYYDARICEPENGNPCVSQPPPPLPPCLGETCHGTPTEAPRVPSAPTATFNGQGNVSGSPPATGRSRTAVKKRTVKCAKGRRRVHGKCRTVRSKGRKASKAKSHKGSHR